MDRGLRTADYGLGIKHGLSIKRGLRTKCNLATAVRVFYCPVVTNIT